MSSRRAESGVCIVRVEVQPEHLLITVTVKRNIGRSLYPADSDPERHFADPDAALAAVAEFLRRFTRALGDCDGDPA
jgi:hypothetical protein